jgi:hypothetical protein
MATQADVRRIALSLPETEEPSDRFAFSVRNKDKLKGFALILLADRTQVFHRAALQWISGCARPARCRERRRP